MPHIPRSMAPSGQVDFSAIPRAPKSTAKKATVPLRSQKPAASPKRRSGNGIKLVQKLSMRDWDVDPIRVLGHLTGKEVTADEFSGMVSNT